MLTFKIRRKLSASAEHLSPADLFIQLINQDCLGLPALLAGGQGVLIENINFR